jgi:hypothetical protein
MSLMDQLVNYVNGNEVNGVNALNDFGRIKASLTQLLGELSKENGSFKQLQLETQNTFKLMGGTNTVNKTRNANKRNMNVTAKNKNQGISKEKRFMASLLLSVMLLCALAHLRGITPFIHSFTQLSILNKKDMFDKVILPFMTMIENSFTFLKTTLLPNIKEGLYTKGMQTMTGMDFATDPNKVMATLTNIGKVQVFMVGLLAPALNLVYKPSVPVIDPTKLGPILDEILKVLNESFKGTKNYVFMEIQPGSYLMKPEWKPDKT